MRPRLSLVGLALFAAVVCASCNAGPGYRPSAAYGKQCQDPDWFGLTACACGRCGRDGFDRDEHRDRPDRDKPDRDPPPFGGKDT